MNEKTRSKINAYLLLLLLLLLTTMIACRQTVEPLVDPGEANAPPTAAPTAANGGEANMSAELTINSANETASNLQHDALLLCQAEGSAHLWRYKTDSQTWHNERLSAALPTNFVPLTLVSKEDGAFILIYGLAQEENRPPRFQTYLWLNNQPLLVLDETEQYRLLPTETQKLYVVRETVNDWSVLELDLSQCVTTNSCEALPTDELLIWSPDGRQAIAQDGNASLLWALDEAGSRDLIGEGFAPFWLDNQRYGYLQSTSGDDHSFSPHFKLMIGSTTQSAADNSALLDSAQLREFLLSETGGQNDDPTYFWPTQLVANPVEPDRLFLLLQAGSENSITGPAYVVTLDAQTKELSWLSDIEAKNWIELALSGDGRYLSLLDVNEILLYGINDDNLHRYPLSWQYGIVSHDWSPDSWLLLTHNNHIDLIRDGEAQSIDNPAGQICVSGVWVQR